MIARRTASSLYIALTGLFALLALWLWRPGQHPAFHPALPTPPLAPSAVPFTATLLLADDASGSLFTERQPLRLPTDPTARARDVLNLLLAAYADPASLHPIAPNPGVLQVFLVSAEAPGSSTASHAHGGTRHAATVTDFSAVGREPGELAVVNLSPGLLRVHPSGIEPENMTLLSMIGTLHANLPQITEVRFLVAGQLYPTLAGHADLTRTYLSASSATPTPGEPSQ